jgi:site-specific DNA-methyltransferase (adenine-specific)
MIRHDFPTGHWLTGDTFEGMATLPDQSVDMILADLPYGTTQNKWDSVLPLNRLWAEYWRIARPNAAIVLTAQPPFDKLLGASQIDRLKYEWIWEKQLATGHLNAKKQPMKAHENVLVFYDKQCLYNPQMTPGRRYAPKGGSTTGKQPGTHNYGSYGNIRHNDGAERYPRSIQFFPNDLRTGDNDHPTRKPTALFDYLIRTYTDPGATILDNTAGSGTTAVAAIRSGRRWVCIERDETYSNAALLRICGEY